MHPEHNGGGAGDGARPATNRIELGGREVLIERISARKAARAFAILRAITAQTSDLLKDAAAFREKYANENRLELDRAQAHMRYGERLDGMTEEAWAAAGNKLVLRAAPSTGELVAAMFPKVLDAAEENVYRLLALFTMSNEDVKRYGRDGSLPSVIDDRVDELLDDAFADELLELAVVCGEVVEEQFVKRVEGMHGRLGNALRLLGINPASMAAQTAEEPPQTTSEEEESTSTPRPSSSRSPSPTDSPAPTGGDPTTSSSSPGTSSAESAPASTPSRPG